MKSSKTWSNGEKEIFTGSLLIANLDQELQETLCEKGAIANFDAGTTILEQGTINAQFFVLLAGVVKVNQSDDDGHQQQLATLVPGDYFGEQALLGNAGGRTSASIMALEPCRTVAVSTEVFLALIATNAKNRAILDRTVLVRCPPIAELSADQQQSVVDAAKECTISSGENIIVQDTVGETFYILLEGMVDVVRADIDEHELHIISLGPGAYFGEQTLMGHTNRRSVTIRANTDCRVIEIGAVTFAEEIATSSINIERFEKDASRQLYEQVAKSLDSFTAKEFDESTPSVSRMIFSPGEKIVVEGTPSESAYMLLDGVALVVKTKGTDFHELARMSGGQVLGEKGVLESKPRSATAIAETRVEALCIEAGAFKRWYKAHPKVADFFGSLSQVYSLSQGRRLSLFLGDIDGHKTVTSVAGTPSKGVVSTRVLGQGVVVFSNASASTIDGERANLVFENDRLKRELRGIVTSRKNGKIQSFIIYGIAAEGIENDLGTLYQSVSQLTEVEAVALRRFERTGFLGTQAEKSERLCPCLGFGAEQISEAAEELGYDFDCLQANIGVGNICGGCERAVCGYLTAESARVSQSKTLRTSSKPETKVPEDAPCADFEDIPASSLSSDELRLAQLLERGMGNGAPSTTQQQIAVQLRSTGVRDMNKYIDIIFSGAFAKHTRVSFKVLAAAVGRGMGFGSWRKKATEKPSRMQVIAKWVLQFLYKIGRKGIVAGFAASLVAVLLIAPSQALAPISITLVLMAALVSLLWRFQVGRIVAKIVSRGPQRLYSVLFDEFDSETKIAKISLGAAGTNYLVRDEELVDEVLQNPEVYGRDPITSYPPFGAHSQLGGGSGGVWLGYRVLFEDYFAEGYRADLDELRAVVQARIKMWDTRSTIMLLDEVYKIVVEIRARLFFQTTFDCFDDNAPIDYAKIVDRVLGLPVFLFSDLLNGEVAQLQRKVDEAVRGSSKEGSVGKILLDALHAGALNEREVQENAMLYMLAQAPTMGIFWTIYRVIHTGRQAEMVDNRKELVKAIKEELRLHAPVTSMFPRRVKTDDLLGDEPVKEGEGVILCPMYIQTNPAHWTDPQRYDPDRWTSSVGIGQEIVEPTTDPDDKNSRPTGCPFGSNKKASAASRYLPFGGGSQSCQGRWFAADEMLIVIEEILKAFEFQIADDQGLLDKALKDQVLVHVYNRPSNDVKLALAPVPNRA
jgi:CRP-like cAMP-binding protein/cytochrome P450/bacterioferritin-associated ferredoxin